MFLEQFFIYNDNYTTNAEQGHYILSLVFLSWGVATIGAHIFIQLILKIKEIEVSDSVRVKAQFVSSIVLGSAVWSMHFVGMLAYDMRVYHTYDTLLTIVSMIIAVIISYFFVNLITTKQISKKGHILSSLVLGVAICAMHYIGMAAMIFEGKLFYLAGLFCVSVGIAIGAAYVAIWLIKSLEKVSASNNKMQVWGASITIGSAIAGMHYTAMIAAVFLPSENSKFIVDQTHPILALSVVAVTGLIYIASWIFFELKVRYREGVNSNISVRSVTVSVSLLCMSIIILGMFIVTSFNNGKAQQSFHEAVLESKSEIFLKHGVIDQILHSSLGLFYASNNVDADEWNTFITSQRINPEWLGVEGIGYVEAKVSSLADTENQYYYTSYSKQAEGTEEKLIEDFDWQLVIPEALDDSESKIWEVPPHHKSATKFLMLLPVVEQESVSGFIVALLNSDFFKFMAVTDSEIEFGYQVWDGEKYDHRTVEAHDHNLAYVEKPLVNQSSIFQEEIVLNLSGKEFRIVVSAPQESFAFNTSRSLVYLAFFVGVLLSAAVVALTYLLISRLTVSNRLNDFKDQFLANMSHEFRTPLNSIIGFIRILKQAENLSKEQENQLEIVHKSSEYLLKVVNDVLDLSKIMAGKSGVEVREFEIIGVIYSVYQQFLPYAQKKEIIFKSNHEEFEPTMVLGDEHKLQKVIINLIGNALKYTEKGSVEILINIEDEENGEKLFHFSVKDTGVGIEEEKQKSIFDAFVQENATIERKYGGTGLGLNITQKMVEAMGGEISLWSKKGLGTAFEVVIPLTSGEGNATDTDNELVQNDNTSFNNIERIPFEEATVLVAEDHEFNQALIKKLLERCGCKDVDFAPNGAKAVKYVSKVDYDLILMDCHMPELNGYDAAKQICDHYKENPNKPFIIAMTADVMPGTREKCLSCGMDEYISKPIDEIEFLEKLSSRFVKSEGEVDTEVVKEFKPPVIDLEIIKQYSGGDLEFELELIEIFFEKSKKEISLLSENCVGGQNSVWSEAAHSLKGGAAYVGAGKLVELSAKAQDMINAEQEEREKIYLLISKEVEEVWQALQLKYA